MAQDYAASISGVMIRVSSLNADGTLVKGPSAAYQSTGFIQLTLTPEYEAGVEYTQKNASGQVAVTYRTDDVLKRVTLALGLTTPDPELVNLISGGVLLSAAGQSVGWAAEALGVNENPNGVALEIWTNAIVNGRPAITNPYWHWIIPFAKLHLNGNRVLQEGLTVTDFTGYGNGNSGFMAGPAAPTWPFQSDRAYAYARCATLPTGPTGFVTVT